MNICKDAWILREEGLACIAVNICQIKVQIMYIQPQNTSCSKVNLTYQLLTPARRETYYLFSLLDNGQPKLGLFTFMKERVPSRARKR